MTYNGAVFVETLDERDRLLVALEEPVGGAFGITWLGIRGNGFVAL